MKGNWKIWHPKENLLEKYRIDTVDGIEEELTIRLSNEINNKKLLIKWEVANSYTYSNGQFNNELSESFDLTKWTFFKTKNSKYIEWVREQSWYLYEKWLFDHFVIVGSNAVLDIIIAVPNQTTYDPITIFEE
jgi:hypothetical protein